LTGPLAYNVFVHRELQSRRLGGMYVGEKKSENFRLLSLLTHTYGYTHLIADFDNSDCISFATGPSIDRGSPYGESAFRGMTLIDDEIVPDRVTVPVPVGCMSIAADFDGDGKVDILARGFWLRPQLMRNLGGRRFIDITSGSGLENMPSGGAIAVADFNNDGLLDIFCTGCGAPGGAKLYLNQGNGVFKDCTEGSGLVVADKKEYKEKFGTATVADFDNDGRVDIFVCDGDKNRLYRNLGNGKFEDVTKASGIPAEAMPESSNAAGDYDADGLVDILLVTPVSGVGLFHNTTANANGWIKIKLHGPRGNPEAAGAKVYVYKEGKLGDKSSLLGFQENIFATELKLPNPMHFGLGQNAKCDIRVIFPDKKTVDRAGAATKTCVEITEPNE